MGLLNRVVKFFWETEKPKPLQRVYGGAEFSRLTADWFTSILSADQELKGDLRRLRGAARAMVRDNPYAARYVQLLAENVVGAQGIQLQVRLGTTRGTINQQSTKVEKAWEAWGCDPKSASADGRLTWKEMLHLIVRSVAMDGEVLIRHVRGADNPWGYGVQILDADLLDEQLGNASPVVLTSGNLIVMGVEVEPRYRRPVAYWLLNSHPSEPQQTGLAKYSRIPAEEIEHIYLQTRAGQTRGVTWFAPVMFTMQMRAKYEEAALTAARIGAASTYGVTYDPDKLAAAGIQPQAGESSIPREVEPGLIPRFAPGEMPIMLPMQYPDAEMAPFLKNFDLSQAAGLNVSKASLTGDLSDVNFSSLRAGKLSERDFYRVVWNLVTTRTCRPVFREWARFAALMGRIPARDVEEYTSAAQWNGRGWPFVQPLEEAQANQIAVQQGWKTNSQVCAEMGVDFEDNITRLAEENAFAAENGVTLGEPVPAQPTDNTDGNQETQNAARLRLARSAGA
jgi:lambda family phage portal protein